MKLKIIIALFAGLIFVGCAGKGYFLYNLNSDYQTSLYNYEKDGDHAKMLQFLDKVIADNPKRVPPGIYAQYGYILSKQGESQKAVLYFQKEMELYPESRVFMKRLIEKIDGGK